jgi:hypothetical protein
MSMRYGRTLLVSTDLAEARGLYEERLARWEHDATQLERQKSLHDSNELAEKDSYDTVNDDARAAPDSRSPTAA